MEKSVIERAQQFADAIGPVVEAFKKMADAIRSLAEFRIPDIQSSKLYAMAGRPYGNNTRGKKRWLREMKRI